MNTRPLGLSLARAVAWLAATVTAAIVVILALTIGLPSSDDDDGGDSGRGGNGEFTLCDYLVGITRFAQGDDAAPDRPTSVLAELARSGDGDGNIDSAASGLLELDSVVFLYVLPVSDEPGLRLPDIPDELAESYSLFAEELARLAEAPGSRPAPKAIAAAERVEGYVAECPGKPAGGPPPLPDPAAAAMLLDPDDMGTDWVSAFAPDAYEFDVGPIDDCLDLRVVAEDFAEIALYGPDDDPIVIETVAVAQPGDGTELFDRLLASLDSCATSTEAGGARQGDGPRHRLFDIDLADESVGVEVHSQDPDAEVDRSTRIAYARLGDVILSVIVSEDDLSADESGTLTYSEIAVTKAAARFEGSNREGLDGSSRGSG